MMIIKIVIAVDNEASTKALSMNGGSYVTSKVHWRRCLRRNNAQKCNIRYGVQDQLHAIAGIEPILEAMY